MMFPSGTTPFTFADTLPAGSTTTAAAPFGAQQVVPITTVAPEGQMYLTFIIFAYPNADNAGPTGAPLVPIVEILTLQQTEGPNPWQILSLTQASGENSISLASSDRFVDYTYLALGTGLFQIAFQQNDVAFDNLDWSIRFTINDGVTSVNKQTGLTFTVGSTADALAPWIALPAQPPTFPPTAVDFGLALAANGGSLTLAGASGGRDRVNQGDPNAKVMLPIGNYGTAPLIVTDIIAPSEANGFAAQFAANPVTIAPGCFDASGLEVSFFVSITRTYSELKVTTPATTFMLKCNDCLAANDGSLPHANVACFYCTYVFVPIGTA